MTAIVAKAVAGARLDEPEHRPVVRRARRRLRACHRPRPMRCARQSAATTVRYVVNRNINYTNICYYRCSFCAFSKGKTHEALRGTPYDLELDEIVRRCTRGLGSRRDRSMPAGRHPPRLHWCHLCRHLPRDQGRAARHARPCLLAARGHARRGDSRPVAARFPGATERRRVGHAAGHRRGDPRRRGSQDHLPGQGQHGTVARRGEHRARARPAHDIDDHVRPRRTPDLLGAASAGLRDLQAATGGIHRVRAAAVRAHGSADVSYAARRGRGRRCARRC